jgi:hypothetical protein
MEITVTQKKGEKYNNNLVKDAAFFFATKLIKNKHLKKISKIKIYLVKEFESAGECYDYKTDDGSYLFDLKINRETDFPEIISTLAHEMIHVSQIVSGNLVIDKNEWHWCGKSYGRDPYSGLGEEQQCAKLPWERDAYHNESKLSLQFFEHYYTTLC